MIPFHRSSETKISALIADVDGTLVTNEKVLTDPTIAAVALLRTHEIAFSVVSSRPPRGLRQLLETLRVTTPIAGFNGGMITTPGMSVIEQHMLSPEAARRAVDSVTTQGARVWVFSGQDWLVRDSTDSYIDLEIRTVGFQPTFVEQFGRALDTVAKIVGVSDDFDLLAQCEPATRLALAGDATVALSQRYYLDITHPLANKGTAVLAIAKLLAIPMAEIAVIGDGGNDVAMFAQSDFSIAMGNATPDVKEHARFVTDSNDEEGFAKAIARFVLGDAARMAS